MSLDKIANRVIETDLLVVGGGVGGCSQRGRSRGVGDGHLADHGCHRC